MGIAQYDPAALCPPAWNAGEKVGAKSPETTTDLGSSVLSR